MKKVLFILLATLGSAFAYSPASAQRIVRVKLSDAGSTLNAHFPRDYTDRTFIKGLAMYRNKIEDLVGCLILLEDKDKASIIGQYIKSGEPPLRSSTLSDVLYNSKISSASAMNGSYMVASVAASTASIVEVILTDVNGVLVPETSIPYLDICRAAKNVDKEIKKKIYYIRSAKVTSVHSRTYQEINTEAGISGTVFSAGGKVYNSSDQFKTDYVVSVDLVSLTNLLMTKNCDNLISNSELAVRQQVQQEKMVVDRAEQERRIRESELNAARAEANELKNRVAEMQEMLRSQRVVADEYRAQVNNLKDELMTAQKKVTRLQAETVEIQNKASQVTASSQAQPAAAENKTNNLVQKSDISVISEVKNLSSEEVKQMGFKDVKPE
ncbi:hypothetical protein [Hymenobacter cavernae]|uniref:Uncharacterized protein n=1 Tax=Hymenobacter cavernae TaxID=2044852 RepID=A0ABQ1UL36_9BACT|nr:hypothetical protein [Hymenobacter cavernae]GGF19180.1 hypothetical protein GCM10011383_33390 [Hymenobacter cavernae]